MEIVGADPCVCPADQKTPGAAYNSTKIADPGRTHGFAPTGIGAGLKWN